MKTKLLCHECQKLTCHEEELLLGIKDEDVVVMKCCDCGGRKIFESLEKLDAPELR